MWVLEFLILSYFVYVVLYTTIFSVGGFFYKEPVKTHTSKSTYSRFCVLIPCYKEDSVILDVAKKALEQSYPHDQYNVVVIADSLQESTLIRLRELPIQVVEVHFESSTKVKSLNHTLQLIENNYDYAVILDADNVMEYDFLKTINSISSPTTKAIQGQRKPKNKNNSLALLDGISEAINNHIYRQGTVSLGLSSSISGSGVVFDFTLLKEKLSSMDSVGGFDRELEVILLLEGIKVGYLKSAVVYDEKVSQNKAFQNQRKRWISSQYFYLRKYFNSGIIALFKGDFAFFNSAILRNIQLPRLINIGLLTSLTVTFFFIRNYLYFAYTIWIILLLLNTLSILIAIPREFFNKKLTIAIFQLPILFLNMFLLLFKLKGANKKFIHTPHGASVESAEASKPVRNAS
jgi:cellulose synthase/poly-beta-1,6-N-acetylglucosamine synthase-like glycosyltransferase